MENLDFLPVQLAKIEIFVDFDIVMREYLMYIIDNKFKVVILYKSNYAQDAIKLILEKYKKFNVEQIGLYGINEYLFPISLELQKINMLFLNRIDIFEWRMLLDKALRNYTRPIAYYTCRMNYKMVTEDEYIEIKTDKVYEENKL